MAVNYVIAVATKNDIPGVLAIQEPNLPENGGGLSVRQTADWFKRKMAEMPLIVARRGDKVVGYTVATALATETQAPIAQAMWRSFPAPPNCYYYGPVCVAESERGKGLAVAMFERLRMELPDRPAMAFVDAENLAARRAYRKMAMQQLGVFTSGDITYVAFRY